MTATCRDIAARASEHLDGQLPPEARRAVEEHLATCGGCRALYAQLETTRRALGHLPPPEVPPALRDALLAGFDAFAAQAAARAVPPRVAPWSMAGVLAVLLGLVAAGAARSGAPSDLVVSAGLGAAALLVAAAGSRFSRAHALAGSAAAALAALATGRAGALEPRHGLACAALELGGAGAVAALAWLVARRGSRELARRALAGGAVAGALAADAALQLTCGPHLALLHVAAFHVALVVAVATAAAWWVRGAQRPAEA